MVTAVGERFRHFPDDDGVLFDSSELTFDAKVSIEGSRAESIVKNAEVLGPNPEFIQSDQNCVDLAGSQVREVVQPTLPSAVTSFEDLLRGGVIGHGPPPPSSD